MHARTPANKPARGRWTPARGRTSQHKSGTRVQSRVLAYTHDVLFGTRFDQYAWGRSGQP